MLSQTINPPKTYVQGIYKAPTCYHVSPRSRKSNTDSNFHSLSSPPPICFSLTPLCSLALMRRGKFICNTQAAQCPHTSEVQALAFCTDPYFPSLRGLPVSLHNPLIQVTAINPLVPSTWRGQAHHSVVLSAQDPLLCLQQSAPSSGTLTLQLLSKATGPKQRWALSLAKCQSGCCCLGTKKKNQKKPNDNYTGQQTSTLFTLGWKSPTFFGPNYHNCARRACYHQCFPEGSTSR